MTDSPGYYNIINRWLDSRVATCQGCYIVGNVLLTAVSNLFCLWPFCHHRSFELNVNRSWKQFSQKQISLFARF